jgi:hypothetical protein
MYRAFRSVLFAIVATATLAGCMTGYSYRAGEGDYYYAEPSIEYYDAGSPYGSFGYGYPSGWHGSFGYGYGYGPGIRYDRYGHPSFGYPSRYWGHGYGGFYGYPPSYYYGRRPPYHRPPQHNPPPGGPQNPPPPGPPGGGMDPPGPPRGGEDPPGSPRRDPEFGGRDLERGNGAWPRREPRQRMHSSQPAEPARRWQTSPPGPESQPAPRRDDPPPREVSRRWQTPPEAAPLRSPRDDGYRPPRPQSQPAYDVTPRREMVVPALPRQVDLPEREHGREP